jgi:hypothetical protein
MNLRLTSVTVIIGRVIVGKLVKKHRVTLKRVKKDNRNKYDWWLFNTLGDYGRPRRK